MQLHWSDHLLFLILGILVPLYSMRTTPSTLRGLRFDTATKIRLYWANNVWLWLMALVVALVWYWHGRPWSYLGFAAPQPSGKGWPYLAAGVFVVLYLGETLYDLWTGEGRKESRKKLSEELGFLPTTRKEFLHFISVAVTAGFCEEVVFRAYFIRYAQAWLGLLDPTHTLSILLPALVFGVVHAYQGWQAVVKVSCLGVLFGYIFVYTQSIALVMLIHFAVDFWGGWLAWRLLRDPNGRNAD